MELELWWYASVGVCACILVLYLVWKHHTSHDAKYGAPSLPLVGCIPFILLNKHRFYEWTSELFDQSPSLMLHNNFGHTIALSTANPEVVQHILKTNFDGYHKGPNFYTYFDDILGNGILNCDGPLWRFQRKVASHVFTSNSLKDFVILVADVEICKRVLPTLDLACGSASSAIDLQALLTSYTFDTACQLTFGADPACLHVTNDDGEAVHDPTSHMKVPHDLIRGFVRGFQLAVQITAERFLVPKFIWEIKKYFKIGSEKKLLDALQSVSKFTDFVIAEAKRGVGDGKHLLARFMQLSKTEVESLLEGEDEAAWKSNADWEHDPQALSDSLLRGILISFIFAGTETVTSGATFFMWHLSAHPRVKEAVLNEIRDILEERKLKEGIGESSAKVGTFSYEEIRKMNYLHAALSESMRLYPPVPSDCKYATQDDVLPDGTKVLAGDQVSYNVFAMGRADRVWGKDCLEFKPERWLAEDGNFMPANPYKYPVFQAGPRICLGKDFAFIQMKLLVASILRDFEFVVQPGFRPVLSYGINLLMLNGLPLLFKRRSDALS